MKKIVQLSETQIKKALKQAYAYLKQVCKENEDHFESLTRDEAEMAEEAAQRSVDILEDYLHIVQKGKPVYVIANVTKKKKKNN